MRAMNRYENMRFWILVLMTSVSGFTQGMLLPLISIIFEKDGIDASLNGLNATGLYIGVLFASPLMEAPLRKFGYKPLILTGGLTVFASLLLFPAWKSLWFWFILRLFIGIGDHMLNFSAQTWITSFSRKGRLGRNIALYGLFFSLGFAVGPYMTRLVNVDERLPFITCSIISLCFWLTVFLLKNEHPEADLENVSFLATFQRFGKVWKLAWVALLPPLGYGFMESSLNSSFPVYALRNGINVDAVSMIIPAFSIGSIVFQLPLGMLSDRFGRRKVLIAVLLIGCACFAGAAFSKSNAIALFACFFVAGMAVGSTFSLGISYLSDLLPRPLLPAGNIMCGILYSFGSMAGPYFCGVIIKYTKGPVFFLLICMLLLVLSVLIFRFKKTAAAVPRHS
ncbi:MFS transporter [Heyndrickxia faecalis]|uniref:MFS transporter n=1 Tax=Heyndrickxia faecalis TaxID=2824910 RepID=A0AAU7WHT1_9BACI